MLLGELTLEEAVNLLGEGPSDIDGHDDHDTRLVGLQCCFHLVLDSAAWIVSSLCNKERPQNEATVRFKLSRR